MRRRPLMIVLLVGLAGCASGSQPVSTAAGDRDVMTIMDAGQPVQITIDRDPSRHKVAASLLKTWNSMAPAYEALGIPLEYADARAHRAGNSRFITSRTLAGQPMSKMLRCGEGITGPAANSHRITIQIWTELKPVTADSTAVFTQLEAKASPVSGTGTTVTCVTTGMLENAIVKLLQLRAALGPG